MNTKAISITLFPLFLLLLSGYGIAKPPKCKNIDIPIFETDAAPRPYVVIGKIYEAYLTPNNSRCEILRKALENGGEAVLRFRLSKRDNPNPRSFLVFTGPQDDDDIMPNLAEAIIVRWSREGEMGISKITGQTLLPILTK